MKSVMSHDFSRIPKTDSPRSSFDRSHGVKTAFDSGYLIPIEVQEVLPGDEVNLTANLFARLAPVVTPVMDNVFLDTQFFFVPSRLLWTNFVKMMGERVNPRDSIDYLTPQLNSGTSGFSVGSLADYFGIPTNVPNLNVSALPFRAYQKIYDDWYRDENLQDSIIQSSSDLGDDNGSIAWNSLRKRGKRHDYFTSCLPSPQKGPGVDLGLTGHAPINYGEEFSGRLVSSGTAGGNPVTDSKVGVVPSSSTSSQLFTFDSNKTSTINGYSLYADMSQISAISINSLRMAFQLQRLLEADARGGTRFCEIIANHFRTICPDARLQRSEYLCGSSKQIGFSTVAQTSGTPSEQTTFSTPQGNLVANGSVFDSPSFHKSFTEHGWIIGLVSVRCDLNYQQGLNRMWSRRGRYDYFWPTLQNLGEQAVLNKEIFAQGNNVKDSDGNVVDDSVFGYQERYAEYRYNPSIITGKLRSTASNSLDVWHLAQKFDSLPTLSSEFIEDNPPLSRILAVDGEPEIILDSYIHQIWTRPMMCYSIPGLVDHL